MRVLIVLHSLQDFLFFNFDLRQDVLEIISLFSENNSVQFIISAGLKLIEVESFVDIDADPLHLFKNNFSDVRFFENIWIVDQAVFVMKSFGVAFELSLL